MDNKISTDYIHQSQLVHSSMQNIAGELARYPIDDKKYYDLTKKLDATLKILHTIKEQPDVTLFGQIASDVLAKEMASLYGRVTKEWIKHKADRIQEKKVSLENSME